MYYTSLMNATCSEQFSSLWSQVSALGPLALLFIFCSYKYLILCLASLSACYPLVFLLTAQVVYIVEDEFLLDILSLPEQNMLIVTFSDHLLCVVGCMLSVVKMNTEDATFIAKSLSEHIANDISTEC